MLFFVFVFKCSLGEINMYILMQSNNCSAIKSIFMIQFFFFGFFYTVMEVLIQLLFLALRSWLVAVLYCTGLYSEVFLILCPSSCK